MMETMLDSLQKLNRSKYFLGFFIIFLNLSSKFITIRLNDYHEQFMRDTIGRELMIFGICFVGTRDILVALVMSSLFIVLNDFLFNDKSAFCIIPKRYRHKMKAAIDTNKDDKIDTNEIKRAIEILNRANKQKIQENLTHCIYDFYE